MTISLRESFRALFYAPFYAAHALDAYRAQGIDVVLEPVMAPAPIGANLAGASDVVWGGPMRVLVHRDRDPASDLVCFCEVVQRDPFFLVGRDPRPDFKLAELVGLRFVSVTEVPTPWMCLQDDLRQAGIDPDVLDRRDDLPMADSLAALLDGSADVVQLFEPFVTQALDSGRAHIWYAAASRGLTSYTCLYSSWAKLADRRADLAAVARGMQATLDWVHGHSSVELAALIGDYFPDLDRGLMARCFDRYKALELWGRDGVLLAEGFDRLRGALLTGGLIATGAAYEDCVDITLAKGAVAR